MSDFESEKILKYGVSTCALHIEETFFKGRVKFKGIYDKLHIGIT